MGILTGIAAGAKALFGVSTKEGRDNVMTVAKGIGGFIDEQQFTDQEKAEFKAKAVEAYAGYLSQTVDENTARSISRRVLAMWIIRCELLILFLSAALHVRYPDTAAYLYKIATDSPLALLTLGVGAFFFGTHLVRAAK